MKLNRSKLFFIVCFLFLIIALYICRINNDDDGLTKLTLSASIASFVFSISDIALTLARGEVDLLEGKRKLLSANKTDSANTKNSISNSRMYYGIQIMYYGIHMFLHRLKHFIAGLSFAMGCLSLLIIVMFYDPVSFDPLIKAEKPITVIAFAVVFLNYIFGEFETEEQNKRNKETEKKDTD